MSDIVIRHLTKEDLQEADRIIRLAFGTFRGHDDPENYRSDARYAASTSSFSLILISLIASKNSSR